MSTPAVQTQGLTKRFGATVALSDLNLEVGAGEVLGCLGPNGAGKTTLIRLLLGLLRPTSGSSTIFGLDSRRDTVAAHRRLAYVAGDVNLWPTLTGSETLHLLGQVHGEVDEKYREELVERFSLDPSRKVRALSKGNRQKIALIGALMCRADLLILDEPTSGLDPIMEQTFRACIEEARLRGQSVLLSSHILSEVEALCDRVAILRASELVEVGTLSEMRHLSATTVQITFDTVAPDLSGVEGVSMVVVTGRLVTCQVHGSMSALLRSVADAGAIELVSREPSLEELFLAHYGSEAVQRGTDAVA